jgi:hypothetical protein
MYAQHGGDSIVIEWLYTIIGLCILGWVFDAIGDVVRKYEIGRQEASGEVDGNTMLAMSMYGSME